MTDAFPARRYAAPSTAWAEPNSGVVCSRVTQGNVLSLAGALAAGSPRTARVAGRQTRSTGVVVLQKRSGADLRAIPCAVATAGLGGPHSPTRLENLARGEGNEAESFGGNHP